MTLTIHTEEDEQRQLKVTVEVPEERVEQQMKRTAREIARSVDIPGFRRGRVPYNIIVQRVGREALRSEAVEEILEPVFEETLAELDVTPYAQPKLDDLEMEPMVIKFTIPMEPTVELGDYRSIRRELPEVNVTDEAVQEALEHIRTHHEVLEPVDRPIEEGDVVTLSGTGKIAEDDEVDVIFDEERIELLMDPETTFAGTDFVKNLIGLEVGDHHEFTITFPEDEEEAAAATEDLGDDLLEEDVEEPDTGDVEAGDENAGSEAGDSLAGEEASFSVTILDVKSRYLPELDDELAREEGDYESLDEMREAVRKDLWEQAEADARDELFDDVMEQVIDGAHIIYPPAVVEEEIDSMVQSLKQQVTRSGWEWSDYLMLQGETEDSLRESYQENAVERVKSGLVLRKFIEEERLSVEEDEVEDAIDERLSDRFDDNEELREQMRDFFRQGQGLEMVTGELVMDKVFDRMEAIVTGNAPSLEALAATEEEEEAAPAEDAAAEEE